MSTSYEQRVAACGDSPAASRRCPVHRRTLAAILGVLLSAGVALGAEPVALLLEKSGVEPALDRSLAAPDPSARAEALARLATTGLLLVPDSTNKRIMAFAPEDGALLDPDFIPSDPAHLATPVEAIAGPDGRTLLVSDQVNDAVLEYELSSGAFVRHFAPVGGADPDVLDNARGIAMHDGLLLVTSADSTNHDSVVMFDGNGSFAGHLVAPGAGGLLSPFDIAAVSVGAGSLVARQWLIPGTGSHLLHRFEEDGAPAGAFVAVDSFPEQVEQIASGNVLVAVFNGAQSGIVEIAPTGEWVGRYLPASLSGLRGVHALDNGNLLTTSSSGVFEIDRLGNLVATRIADVSARFISRIGPWVPSAPLPAAASHFDAEVFERRLYLPGFRASDGSTDGTVWSRDLATGQWSDTGVEMPIWVSDYSIARLTDAEGPGLFVFGGRDVDGECVSEVQVFRPDSGVAEVVASDPWPGTIDGLTVIPGGVAVVDNRAIVWGGDCPSAASPTASAQTWIYDPRATAGNRWSAGPDLPSPAAGQASAVVDGRVYSLGGDAVSGSARTAIDTVLVLDPKEIDLGWQPRAAIPPLGHGTSGCDGTEAFGFDSGSSWRLAGKIVLPGCGQWPEAYADSFAYDVASNQWMAVTPLARRHRDHASAFLVDDAGSARMWKGGGVEQGELGGGLIEADACLVLSSSLIAEGFETGDLGAWPGVSSPSSR